MLDKLKTLCETRENLNESCVTDFSTEPSNRCKYIMNVLDSLNIKYELDTFESELHMRYVEKYNLLQNLKTFHNIYIRGNSKYMLLAHHDVVERESDNANDNSASIINIINYLTINPDMNACFTDGEEIGFYGAKRLVTKIHENYFGEIKSVLNLELTGIGGANFFIGDYSGHLLDNIVRLFNPMTITPPPCDTNILRDHAIDSTVITTLPRLVDGDLDMSYLYNCHTLNDSLETVSIKDMQIFVTEVLVKLFQNMEE